MKKISLKNLNLKDVDQLTREQLKNVLGGYSNGTTGGFCNEDHLTTHQCAEKVFDGKGCWVDNAWWAYPCSFPDGGFYGCVSSKTMCDHITVG
jgi:hypothetical protein